MVQRLDTIMEAGIQLLAQHVQVQEQRDEIVQDQDALLMKQVQYRHLDIVGHLQHVLHQQLVQEVDVEQQVVQLLDTIMEAGIQLLAQHVQVREQREETVQDQDALLMKQVQYQRLDIVMVNIQ